jgi:hypothetical protein
MFAKISGEIKRMIMTGHRVTFGDNENVQNFIMVIAVSTKNHWALYFNRKIS